MRRALEEIDEDLLLIDGVSVALILTTVFVPDSPLRIVLGIPFVLFFPGYTLTSTLFPRRQGLDGVERLALSIGLNLAVLPLIGLVLNYTPLGLRLYPTLLSLFLFTILMSIASSYRRQSVPAEERFPQVITVHVSRWRELIKANKIMSVGIVTSVIVTGGLTAHFASTPRLDECFTEFYLLGPSGKLADYPTNLTLGESGTGILGILNHEYEEVAYTIVIKWENETIDTIKEITLNHEAGWSQNYTFTPEKTGDRMMLEFLLFRDGVDEAYRSLHIWITVRPR